MSVCVLERQREREGEGEGGPSRFHLFHLADRHGQWLVRTGTARFYQRTFHQRLRFDRFSGDARYRRNGGTGQSTVKKLILHQGYFS